MLAFILFPFLTFLTFYQYLEHFCHQCLCSCACLIWVIFGFRIVEGVDVDGTLECVDGQLVTACCTDVPEEVCLEGPGRVCLEGPLKNSCYN